MSQNTMRWKWGDVRPITVPAKSAVAIQQGDLLWLNSDGEAEPASTFAYDTSLAETRATFTSVFLGVAMQASPAGNSAYIRVATSGVFEYDDATQDQTDETFGTLMGPVMNTAGTYLERAKVTIVSSTYLAVGRVAHLQSRPSGKVLIEILSTVMHGGVPGSDPTHATRA